MNKCNDVGYRDANNDPARRHVQNYHAVFLQNVPALIRSSTLFCWHHVFNDLAIVNRLSCVVLCDAAGFDGFVSGLHAVWLNVVDKKHV